ncbi:MAG: hypothetical protein A3F87_03490 [Omnitrophica WOR_2 bacterium RIFCSPLOWO2_12_FULL_51_24]|nr:MAG: hypothetical protein A2879_01885 [Omnitrophica WOR_2 bacterium RIFCSPHIGHO2_01_FULL_49_10]OGX32563.1 MAG: hypothetical protein A3I43_00035 [Omnitrophica WOR_2 bacterium RIFCSPLOWO2_02_FULL_50_19]OGX43070.1 MAG: hypothetical protein A3F87_03490 [Omnitrophica WOR_2 bacterium RIFCSPLOWO2_12_FULL_51_24]
MSVLFYGILTFFSALLIHLMVWRICLPKKNRALILANIFFWTLVLGAVVLRAIPDYLDYIVLYCCLAAAYIVSYPAMEADSPSLVIVRDIARAGRSGLDKSELYKTMSDEILVVARIDDLLADDLIRMDSGKYLLTAKGRFLSGVFVRFRRLLNAPKGG